MTGRVIAGLQTGGGLPHGAAAGARHGRRAGDEDPDGQRRVRSPVRARADRTGSRTRSTRSPIGRSTTRSRSRACASKPARSGITCGRAICRMRRTWRWRSWIRSGRRRRCGSSWAACGRRASRHRPEAAGWSRRTRARAAVGRSAPIASCGSWRRATRRGRPAFRRQVRDVLDNTLRADDTLRLRRVDGPVSRRDLVPRLARAELPGVDRKDTTWIGESFALSTNVLHYEALRLAGELPARTATTRAR